MGRIKEASKILVKVFQDNEWKWHGEGIPTEESIAKTLKHLKKDARECSGYAETGRLAARCDETGYVTYSLEIM